jgi:hypothetical protein
MRTVLGYRGRGGVNGPTPGLLRCDSVSGSGGSSSVFFLAVAVSESKSLLTFPLSVAPCNREGGLGAGDPGKDRRYT